MATYGANPTGAILIGGTGVYDAVAIGAGNQFTSLTVTVCDPGTGRSLEW